MKKSAEKVFDDKVVLITGGTGSFGHKFVKYLLNKSNPSKVIIFSRDEMKQWKMASHVKDDRIRFFIGDVRDKDRLSRAFHGVDIVVHAAATKIVPTAEYNPHECIKTNILGAMNVIDAAIDKNVSKVVALSTDKASSPVNLYGATKLASDKLFTAANAYSGSDGCLFSVVRYGNVAGSRGSVIPFFLSLSESKTTPVTAPAMTRFILNLEDAVELVVKAVEDMKGSELYVKKIPSVKIIDIAKWMRPNSEIEFIGIRPGEKLHEQMISPEESHWTFEYHDYYKILPQTNEEFIRARSEGGTAVPNDFKYASNLNDHWLTKQQFLNMLDYVKNDIFD